MWLKRLSSCLSASTKKAGYELCFQFGGNYYDDEEERRKSVTVFPGCDMRKTITSKLSLENGKVYGFKVTI